MQQDLYAVAIDGIIKRWYTQFYPAFMHVHAVRKALPQIKIRLWKWDATAKKWLHA